MAPSGHQPTHPSAPSIAMRSPVAAVPRPPRRGWRAPRLLSAIAFAAACGGSDSKAPTPPAPRIPLYAVAVLPDRDTLTVGETVTLAATVTDSGRPAPSIAVAWRSSAPATATVSASGVVTAVAPGSALVIAGVSGGAEDTAAIVVEAAPPPLPFVRISEIHYDNVGTDVNEAVEVEGPATTDLTGWSVVLYNGNGGAPYDTLLLAGPIANQCGGRGTRWVEAPGMQNGAPDGLALVNAAGAVVEFLSYEGTMTAVGGPANGMTSRDIGASQEPAPAAGQSLHRDSGGRWSARAANFGHCFGVVPPPANTITFSGRLSSDPRLPVGFEDQLFATLRAPAGETLTTTFTWSSDAPTIATVDARGVVRAVAQGTAAIRATAADGTTNIYAVATLAATASGTASYLGNTEFGDPTDGNPADEIILRRPQYTTSFSTTRGIPNWVSYNLEATHFGAEDRCDCYTYDPELPAAGRYTTADYSGAGTAAGYGIDRGHLVRSADRTAGPLDNARTYYFANIIPQAADNNQGPWAALETHLGDLARSGTKEVYVIAGAAGSKGTVKGEGRITIPAWTWKVAVILPRDAGLAQVTAPASVEVIAVLMPNDPGIRTNGWQQYRVSVDRVEQVSGFDLLSALPDAIEAIVEAITP